MELNDKINNIEERITTLFKIDINTDKKLDNLEDRLISLIKGMELRIAELECNQRRL